MHTTFLLDPVAAHAAIRRGVMLSLDAWESLLLALRAETALIEGDWAAASAHASAVIDRGSVAGAEARCGALRVLGLLRARRGDPGAWPVLDEARDLARDVRELAAVAAARGEVAWLEDRRERVGEETTEALRHALETGDDASAAELARWRRRAGLDDDIAPAPPVCAYETALAGADRGEVDALRTAFYALRSLGAHGAARCIGRRLGALGVRGLPRGPYGAARANPGDLTAREMEVLQLVSEGLRNGEISERLVVSPKTVDHHMSSILRKLDVPTRTAAAHWLRLAA